MLTVPAAILTGRPARFRLVRQVDAAPGLSWAAVCFRAPSLGVYFEHEKSPKKFFSLISSQTKKIPQYPIFQRAEKW